MPYMKATLLGAMRTWSSCFINHGFYRLPEGCYSSWYCILAQTPTGTHQKAAEDAVSTDTIMFVRTNSFLIHCGCLTYRM